MERDTITIRRATRRDIPSLLRLYGSFAAHDDDPDGLSPGAADAIFDRIDADANQALLVAEQDLRIIGTLVLVVVQNLAHCGNPWAIVENVAVHERARAGRDLAPCSWKKRCGGRAARAATNSYFPHIRVAPIPTASTSVSASNRPTSASRCSSSEKQRAMRGDSLLIAHYCVDVGFDVDRRFGEGVRGGADAVEVQDVVVD